MKVIYVVARVHAAVILSEGGEGVAGGRRRATAFKAGGGRAIADEIDNLFSRRARPVQCFRRVHERDLARARSQRDVAGSVRCRQVLPAGRTGAARPTRLLNQQMLSGRERDVRQGRRLPSRPAARRILNRPTGEVRVRPVPVENLNKVMLERRAAVTPATEDLTDNDQWLWRR